MTETYDPYNTKPVNKGKPAKAPKQAKKDKPLEQVEETNVDKVGVGQLRSFIERIERCEEDKKAISDDVKFIYAELKANGYDSKAVRTIIRLRKKEEHVRQEEAAMVDLYCEALGMPLFGGM